MLNHPFISGLQTATRTTRKNDVTVNGEKGHSSMSSYGSFAFLVADASDCGGAGLSQDCAPDWTNLIFSRQTLEDVIRLGATDHCHRRATARRRPQCGTATATATAADTATAPSPWTEVKRYWTHDLSRPSRRLCTLSPVASVPSLMYWPSQRVHNPAL